MSLRPMPRGLAILIFHSFIATCVEFFIPHFVPQLASTRMFIFGLDSTKVATKEKTEYWARSSGPRLPSPPPPTCVPRRRYLDAAVGSARFLRSGPDSGNL